MNSKISVIVPVYNVENQLNMCIESIVNQKYSNIEIILVDDGSTDNSAAICDKWSEKDSRIIAIHKCNGGASNARNIGIENATGEYITFIDSDDYIDRDFLSDAICDLNDNEADIFYSGIVRKRFKNGSIISSVEHSVSESMILTPKDIIISEHIPIICHSSPCAKLFKANMLRQNNIFFDTDMDCGEDAYFNLEVLNCCEKIFFSSKIYYNYLVQNESSLSQRYNPRLCEYYFKISDKKYEMLLKMGVTDSELIGFENHYLSGAISPLSVCYEFEDKSIRNNCKNVLKFIADNEYIKALKIHRMKSLKLKIILLLFKLKLQFFLKIFLDIKYKNKLAR